MPKDTSTYTAQSTTSGVKNFKLVCVDSRNKELLLVDEDVTIIDYSVPKIQLAITRQGYSTNVSISGKCQIAPVIIDGQHYNAKTITIKYKKSSDSDITSNWNNIILSPTDVDDDGYFSIDQVLAGAFSLSEAYNVNVVLTDTAGYSVKNDWLISKAVIIFGMTDNGAVGVNSYPEDEYFLTVGGKSLLKGDTVINGTLTLTGKNTIYAQDIMGNGWYWLPTKEDSGEYTAFARQDENNHLVLGYGTWEDVYYESGGSHTFKPGGIDSFIISSDINISKQSFASYPGNKYGQFYAVHSSSKPSFLIRNDGDNTWFMLTNANDPYGIYNSLRPMSINNTTGDVWFGQHAVFSGATYPQICGNNSVLCLGADNNPDANLCINGTVVRGTGHATTNVTNMHLGDGNHRWYSCYLYTSPSVSSDRNAKHDITDLSDKLMVDFVKDLKPSSFIYNVNDSNRKHYGFISQDVEDTLEKLNISSQDFAGFIKTPKTKDILDENGNFIKTVDVDGEYNYGLRYEEFIAPIVTVVQHLLREVEQLKKAQ